MAIPDPMPRRKPPRGSFLPEQAAAQLPRRVQQRLAPAGQRDPFGDRMRQLGVTVDGPQERLSFLAGIFGRLR